jgi:hypothetical protein
MTGLLEQGVRSLDICLQGAHDVLGENMESLPKELESVFLASVVMKQLDGAVLNVGSGAQITLPSI